MVNILIYLHNFLKYRSLFSLIKSKYLETIYEYKLSEKIPVNSRIVIYGFGTYGVNSFIDLFKTNKIVAVVDKNIKKFPILSPDKILDLNFDYIVVTVMNSDYQKEVSSYLDRLCIPPSKIVFVQYDEYIDVYKK